MKSAEDFWAVISIYNDSTLIFQIFLMVIGLSIIIYNYIKQNDISQILMKLFFATTFAWIGIVFFIVFDNTMFGNFLSAPLFLLISVLFLIDIFLKRITFRFPLCKWQKLFTLIFCCLYFLYPVISHLLGHNFPKSTTLIMPCPFTAFTIIILASAIPKIDVKVYILLLAWAFTGLPKAFIFNVHEDLILFPTGVYGLIMLIVNRRYLLNASSKHISQTLNK
ncbi:MAG: DUF6064 family protein [Clostridia bacterium]|nr:DUF6064 family protein [Clostridia bacterium]